MITVNVHLRRGDGHVAKAKTVDTSQWFEIEDKDGNQVTVFIPSELMADAAAFAESINAYCQKRIGASAV